MGGSGSGNWYRWDKKITVEECRWIDGNRWMREGILGSDRRVSGGWAWTDARKGKQFASIGYQVNTREKPPWLRLYYTISSGRNEGREVDYRVRLQTTSCNYGGVRWWFTCPDVRCGRRVGKLYLPPGGFYFACRHCYDLTYRSCHESDKRVSAILNNPVRLMALERQLESDTIGMGDLHTLLKAYSKMGIW